MLDIPVKYITILSNPNPNPECTTVPYFLVSKYVWTVSFAEFTSVTLNTPRQSASLSAA